MTDKELIDDWNAMVQAVADFSDKHNLLKGELVFHPQVLIKLRSASMEPLLDTFIFNGIRTRFGRFEQMDVLRQP
jgi:hypothetical protein